MACYSPLKGVRSDVLNPETGKRKIVIIPRDKQRDGIDYEDIPCGKCIGCRLEYSRQWAIRCLLELKTSKCAIFVTLTYDDAHLPQKIATYNDGQIKIVNSLEPRDTELFFKRLRKEFGQGIRYYLAGEYGYRNQRPHYHAIIYNLELDDKVLYKQNFRGDKMFTSEKFSKVWGKGFCVIGDVNYDTVAYTARYMVNKRKGTDAKEYYQEKGILPEFCRMSRRPGIARQYFELNKYHIYQTDELFISKGGKPLKVKPPRYYDNLFDVDTGAIEEYKLNRRLIATNSFKIKKMQTTMSEDELLDKMERCKLLSAKRLIRKEL